MILTKEANLTAATLAYTCACIAEGDLVTLSRMGLERDDIEILKQLTLGDIPRLSAMETHFMSIRIDRHCLSRLLTHIKQQRSDQFQRDALIQADAPLALIRSLFIETSASDYCNMRKLFGLEGVGRTPEPEEQEEHAAWKAYTKMDRQLDDLEPADWLRLHESTSVSLRILWLLIKRWNDQPQPDDAQLDADDISHIEPVIDRPESVITRANLNN